MLTLRRSADRGRFDHGWLDTRHTFSFAGYADERWTRFRSLRVLNEDRVRPGRGFGTHPHRDMEIVTVVVSGRLKHEDSAGGRGELARGGVQAMSAGSGLTHSEANASDAEPVHFLQIWLLPESPGGEPTYADAHFPDDDRTGRLRPIVTGTGGSSQFVEGEGGLTIRQDAAVFSGILPAGTELIHEFAAPGGGPRHGWVQLISGELTANGTHLKPGDGAGMTDQPAARLTATADAELLFFDLA